MAHRSIRNEQICTQREKLSTYYYTYGFFHTPLQVHAKLRKRRRIGTEIVDCWLQLPDDRDKITGLLVGHCWFVNSTLSTIQLYRALKDYSLVKGSIQLKSVERNNVRKLEAEK